MIFIDKMNAFLFMHSVVPLGKKTQEAGGGRCPDGHVKKKVPMCEEPNKGQK